MCVSLDAGELIKDRRGKRMSLFPQQENVRTDVNELVEKERREERSYFMSGITDLTKCRAYQLLYCLTFRLDSLQYGDWFFLMFPAKNLLLGIFSCRYRA